jgi:hypothetical protein
MSIFDDEDENDFDDEYNDIYDENHYDDFQDEDENDEDYESDHLSHWKERELQLQEQEVNIMLLNQVIQMLSKSWFWRFKKPEKKLKQVIETYLSLYEIIG